MKHLSAPTAKPVEPTLEAMGHWLMSLNLLHQRLRPHFARPEAHHHALLYLQAVLSEIPRKNGWQIAEYARLSQPSAIQRLLSHATWDQEGVRDELRTFVCQALTPSSSEAEAEAKPGAPWPVLVIDESAFPKRGRHSAGVGSQYCGCSGRVENCQVGVFLSFVTHLGHALIDRALYLPQDWCADLPRRHAAHIPDTVTFRTKPELAKLMIQRAQSAGLSIGWVVADTVYGHSGDLRTFLEEQGFCYALAVPSIEIVCVQSRDDLVLSDVAGLPQQALRTRDWQRLSQSLGTKGERLFDWAMLPWMQAGTSDGRHFLVIRRCLDDPSILAFFLVFAPRDTALSTIVQAIGARWRIEEDLQACKDLGLDHYEVRSFLGWYRHLTLVMMAYAFLVSITVERRSASFPGSAQDQPLAHPALIAFTSCEVRHLLARLLFPAPASLPLIWHWSRWRRAHQYWAGYYHRRRREKAGSAR